MRTLRYVRWSRTSAVKLAARLLVGGYAAFSGLNAQAADLPKGSVIAQAFGNTVISTYPDGRTLKIWLHADGTWDGLSRRNTPLAGRWSVKDEKVCLRQSKPPTLPMSYCTSLPPAGEPGVQWTGRDVVGRPIVLSLMKGMPPGAQETSAGTR